MAARAADALDGILAAVLHAWRRSRTPDAATQQETERVLHLLDRAQPAWAAPLASHHPATRHLPVALDQAAAGPGAVVAAALHPVAADLPWRYGYASGENDAGLERELAWTELVGPGALLDRPDVCLGLTLLGPHAFYPPHAHPAVELYWVVSGTATWIAGPESEARPPGPSFCTRPASCTRCERRRRRCSRCMRGPAMS